MKSQVLNRCFYRITGLLLVIACLNSLPVVGQDTATSCAGKPGRHLFILSGQSNMTEALKQGLTGKVEEAFGKENVAIAMSMKSGRGIRYWCSDYRFSDNHIPSGEELAAIGSLYKPLMDAVKDAAGGKTFDTVTLIWMQGESDSAKGRGEVYEENFMKFLNHLKTDLKRDDMRFVIGRLSDFAMDNPRWVKMREIQVKLAGSIAGGAWIDTDDLNGGEAGVPGGELHYGKAESVTLGVRFATKAIEMIRGAKSASAPDTKVEKTAK